MATHILRLKRTDHAEQHLLLHIAQQKGLSLKLVGTEHEHLYHGRVKEGDIKSLQSAQFAGNVEEFKDILKYALLHERPEGPLPESLQGLETVATINGKALSVTVRKNIGGITQRLATIKLEQDNEREEVSLFEWVDQAVATADTLRSTLEGLQTGITGQRERVAKLTQQLDDLVKAKNEHEDELLKKFAALLNAKKLKIRDQQRLLKDAKIDPDAAEEVDDGRPSRTNPLNSRSSKRKSEPEPADSDDDAFENENEEDRQLQETPPATDAEVADDDDLDGAVAPKPVSTSQRRNGTCKTTNGREKMDVDGGEAPPRRELPFQRKGAQPAQPADEEEEDETDEEL